MRTIPRSALAVAVCLFAFDTGIAAARPAKVTPFQKGVLGKARLKVPGQNVMVAIGDTGTRNKAQEAVSRRIYEMFRIKKFANILMLGDNVYPDGQRKDFHASIRTPYRTPIKNGTRILPILGNHDVRTSRGEDMMKYFGLAGKRYYSAKLAGGQVEVFAIDTNLYFPRMRGMSGNAEWVAKMEKRQLSWLKRRLAASTARYKIVMGHHPMYTSGELRKREQAPRVRNKLEKVLTDHGVHLYLSGHDHHYERSRKIKGVVHVIAGGGGGQVQRGRILPNSRRAKWSRTPHYLTLEVTSQGLDLHTRSLTNETIDHTVIRVPAN